MRQTPKQWAFGNCETTLRATTFDERTNISTMNIADDGNSQTCKYYNEFTKKNSQVSL